MNKRLLTVLSICFVAVAGIALYVWASGCCTTDDLCNGANWHQGNCSYYFRVFHDRDALESGSHNVSLKYRAGTSGPFTSLMLGKVGSPPYPTCVEFGGSTTLEPDTYYQYHFECSCGARDPDGSLEYALNTSDCDEY